LAKYGFAKGCSTAHGGKQAKKQQRTGDHSIANYELFHLDGKLGDPTPCYVCLSVLA
jgi:hypothetical protein